MKSCWATFCSQVHVCIELSYQKFNDFYMPFVSSKMYRSPKRSPITQIVDYILALFLYLKYFFQCLKITLTCCKLHYLSQIFRCERLSSHLCHRITIINKGWLEALKHYQRLWLRLWLADILLGHILWTKSLCVYFRFKVGELFGFWSGSCWLDWGWCLLRWWEWDRWVRFLCCFVI